MATVAPGNHTVCARVPEKGGGKRGTALPYAPGGQRLQPERQVSAAGNSVAGGGGA